jgi:hypothetical protein
MHIDIRATYRSGAYVTNTVRGIRASSTCSGLDAATAFGRKYFGPSFREATAEASDYRVHADDRAVAWCWQTGRIEIGESVPEGAIAFAAGPRRALEEEISAAARHGQGKSKGLLLVPGVPEAETPDAALYALIAFIDWRAKKNGHHQVFFGRDARLPA